MNAIRLQPTTRVQLTCSEGEEGHNHKWNGTGDVLPVHQLVGQVPKQKPAKAVGNGENRNVDHSGRFSGWTGVQGNHLCGPRRCFRDFIGRVWRCKRWAHLPLPCKFQQWPVCDIVTQQRKGSRGGLLFKPAFLSDNGELMLQTSIFAKSENHVSGVNKLSRHQCPARS